MKKIISRSLLAVILFLSAMPGLHAQFFKDMLNSVKNNARNRANSKADKITNKALDKVDSGTNLNSKHSTTNTTGNTASASNMDTSGVSRVLGAFAGAAAANPNDTSSADLTMKALGLLVAGRSISHADSVTAINSYKTANGGSGFHYSYSITMNNNKNKGQSNSDTTQYYFTESGEGRVEMRIPMPGVQMNQTINIGRFSAPGYSLSLYPDSKSYSLNIIDTALINNGETYKLTKIGTETIKGYSCIHSRLVSSGRSRLANSSTTTDIWTTREAAGSDFFTKITSMQSYQGGMMKALEQAGCAGVFVKLTVAGKDYSMEEILLGASAGRQPADLFRIPAGYTESKNNSIFHMVPSSKK